MEEVSRPKPELLIRQDEVMLAVGEQILRADWFRKNVDYYYLRRNDSDGIGLWFRYIQERDGLESIESRVSRTISKIGEVVPEVEREEVLKTNGTRYSWSEKEQREFQTFLRQTTHIALDLIRQDANEIRRFPLHARVSSVPGGPIGFWNAAKALITTTEAFRGFGFRQKRKYRKMFCRIVNKQHWAHFLCNMVLLYDPHPDYREIQCSEEQWRLFLGLKGAYE